jgi:hypothetical protein
LNFDFLGVLNLLALLETSTIDDGYGLGLSLLLSIAIAMDQSLTLTLIVNVVDPPALLEHST